MGKVKPSRQEKLNFIMLAFLIYVLYSYWAMITLSASQRYIISVGFIIVVCVCLNRRIIIDKAKLYLMCFIIGNMLVSCIINGVDAIYDLYFVGILFLVTLLTFLMNAEDFRKAYVDVMTFYAICGVIVFGIYAIFPQLIMLFPNIAVINSNKSVINCFICVINVSSHNSRNMGIFTEPGMFAFFLNVALMLALFDEFKNIKKIGCLLVAIASTLSTAGLITAGLLILAYIFEDSNIEKGIKRKMILMIISVIFILIMFFHNNQAAFSFLTSKLQEDRSSKIGSGSERLWAITYAWNVIKNNPIFGGASVTFHKYAEGIMTFTPLNWFATYGFVYGIIMNVQYFRIAFTKSFLKKDIRASARLFIFLALFTNCISQNLTSNIIMLLLIFYQTGYLKNHKRQVGDNVIAGEFMGKKTLKLRFR